MTRARRSQRTAPVQEGALRAQNFPVIESPPSHTRGGVPFRVYARASHPEQDESVEQQIEVAERELWAMGLLPRDKHLPRYHAPEAGVYVDDGQSAWKVPPEQRVGSAALLRNLAENPQPPDAHGLVWVWAQSRFLRPEFGGAEAVAQLWELSKLGWTIYSHRQGSLDVTTRGERVVKTVMVTLDGEKDSEQSREKADAVRRAKTKQVQAGVWLGGFAPYGYDRWAAILSPADLVTGQRSVARWVELLPTGKRNGTAGAVTLLRPNPETAPWARLIFDLAADGDRGHVVSGLEITRRLNESNVQPHGGSSRRKRGDPAMEWTPNSVFAILTSEMYIAVQRDAATDAAYPALWEPLVERATWDRAQTRLAVNGSQRRGVNSVFPLSGLTVCAHCEAPFSGERMTSHGAGGQHLDYYRTPTSFTRRTPCAACCRRVPAWKIETAVFGVISALTDAPHIRQAILDEQLARASGNTTLAGRREALDAEHAEIRRKIDNLLPALEAGGAVAARVQERARELNRDMVRIAQRRTALACAISAGNATAHGKGGAAELAARAAEFRAVYAAATPAERKALLRFFVARIEVDTVTQQVRVGIRPPVAAAA